MTKELKNIQNSSGFDNFWSEKIFLPGKELMQYFSKEIIGKQKKADFI